MFFLRIAGQLLVIGMFFAYDSVETAKISMKEQGMKIATKADVFGLETKVKSSLETNLRAEIVESNEDVVHGKVQHKVQPIRPKLDEVLNRINNTF